MCTGFDGKVYTIFGSDTVNDLKIYENGRLTTQTIHSPHYSIKNSWKSISQIYPAQNGDLWFCFTDGGAGDAGITILKADGNWLTLTKDNGLIYYNVINNNDSVCLPPYGGVCSDKNGNFWNGGLKYFGYFDANLNLNIPGQDFYNNCTLYSCINNYLSSNDSIINHYFFMITHYYESQHDPNFINAILQGIAVTDDGSIWFLFDGLGILRYKPNETNVSFSIDNLNDDITLYPQPIEKSERKMNIKFKSNTSVKQLKLFSISGSEILSRQINFNGNSLQIEIPDYINAGCYFIELLCGNQIIHKMFLLNN